MSSNSLTVRLALSGLANVEAGLAKLKGGVKALGPVVAGAGAALAGIGAGVAHVTQRAIENADAMAKMSERTGISTESLSALGYAGKLADESLADLETGLKFFAKSQVEAGRGSEDLVEALAGVADQFAGLSDGAAKIDLATKLFGRGGTGLIPLLNQGAAGLRQATTEAREFGVIVDGQTAKAAAEFNDNLTRLKVVTEGTALALSRELVPAMQSLSETALALAKSGTLKAIAGELRPVADYLAAEVRKGVSHWIGGTQAAGSFFGALAAGMSVSEALSEAMKDTSAAVAGFNSGFEKSDEKVVEATKSVREFVAAQDEVIRRLRLSIMGKDAALVGVNSDRNLTPIQRRAEAMDLLTEKLEAVRKLEADLQANAPSDARIFTDEKGQVHATEAQLRFQEQSLALARERLTVEGEIARLGPDPTSIREQFGETFRGLRDQFGSIAQQMAQSFADVFNGAIASISQGITGLIMRTQTWGQALANIGTSILTSVVEAIITMGTRWILTQGLMAIAGKSILAASVAATAPIAAAQALIWATPATLATISSYGGAAAAAPGLIAAAQAATLGLAGISGAFAEGGRPPVGRPALVGERGPELFVPDRPGLIIPADRTAAMLSDSSGQPARPLNAASGQPARTELALFMDQGAMDRWLSKRVDAHVVRVLEGRSHQL